MATTCEHLELNYIEVGSTSVSAHVKCNRPRIPLLDYFSGNHRQAVKLSSTDLSDEEFWKEVRDRCSLSCDRCRRVQE